jgi:hypothetical protein
MSWFSNLFGGGKNPADAAMPYLNQIPGQTQQYQQPFFEAGKNQLPGLQDQYSKLMNDPGGRMNDIGKSFQESPGFKFAMQQAMQGGNHAAAAGGMAGSPQHEQQNMQMATDLGNQEYNNWMDKALGMYGQGLNGSQGMANQGQQAGQSMSDTIAQTLAQQGNLAFQGQRQKNQNQNDLFGGAFNAAGSLAGFNPWGMFGNI